MHNTHAHPALQAHTAKAIARHQARLAAPRPKRVNVVVEVDAALAVGMSTRFVQRLARGVTLESTEDGVEITGLPGLRRAPLRVKSMADAVMRLHALADHLASTGHAAGGLDTATGRYTLDRAALLREVARACVVYRRGLWPHEPWTAA